MAREKVRERLLKLVKDARLARLRGLKVKPSKEEAQPSAPPEEEVAALEAMLGEE